MGAVPAACLRNGERFSPTGTWRTALGCAKRPALPRTREARLHARDISYPLGPALAVGAHSDSPRA